MQCTSTNKGFPKATATIRLDLNMSSNKMMCTGLILKQHGLEHYADGNSDTNPIQPTYMLKQYNKPNFH